MTEITPVVAVATAPQVGGAGDDFWHSLIDEKDAAAFLNLTNRTLQEWRQKGVGPRHLRLSSRCIRYRRIDLKQWADKHVRASTADPGPNGTD